jgi:hypothetical protein
MIVFQRKKKVNGQNPTYTFEEINESTLKVTRKYEDSSFTYHFEVGQLYVTQSGIKVEITSLDPNGGSSEYGYYLRAKKIESDGLGASTNISAANQIDTIYWNSNREKNSTNDKETKDKTENKISIVVSGYWTEEGAYTLTSEAFEFWQEMTNVEMVEYLFSDESSFYIPEEADFLNKSSSKEFRLDAENILYSRRYIDMYSDEFEVLINDEDFTSEIIDDESEIYEDIHKFDEPNYYEIYDDDDEVNYIMTYKTTYHGTFISSEFQDESEFDMNKLSFTHMANIEQENGIVSIEYGEETFEPDPDGEDPETEVSVFEK